MRTIIFILSTVLFVSCSKEDKPNHDLVETPTKQDITIRDRIDGPANIRDTINGEIIFELNDKVLVECGQIHNNWYEVGAFVSLSKDQSQDGIILKGTTLYDAEGSSIGVAKSDLDGGWIIKESQDSYDGFIGGYTFKDNIQATSIAERELEKILNSKEDLTFELFENHIKEFAYREGGLEVEGYETLRQFHIYGSWIEDPSPIDRIRLMFEGDKLISIIHERELIMSGKQSYPLNLGLEILIIKGFEESELALFIENNNRSYYGVD